MGPWRPPLLPAARPKRRHSHRPPRLTPHSSDGPDQRPIFAAPATPCWSTSPMPINSVRRGMRGCGPFSSWAAAGNRAAAAGRQCLYGLSDSARRQRRGRPWKCQLRNWMALGSRLPVLEAADGRSVLALRLSGWLRAIQPFLGDIHFNRPRQHSGSIGLAISVGGYRGSTGRSTAPQSAEVATVDRRRDQLRRRFRDGRHGWPGRSMTIKVVSRMVRSVRANLANPETCRRRRRRSFGGLLASYFVQGVGLCLDPVRLF